VPMSYTQRCTFGMGSFSYTCAVSGFPIQAGDKVRYMLLTEYPYKDRGPCYMHDLWVPRTLPLKAKYNDYGSVEGVESGPSQDLWMEGFKRDLIEMGWGDNPCHDVPTSKGMTFEDLLTALGERRVYVNRHYVSLQSERIKNILDTGETALKEIRGETAERSKPLVPKGIPTLRRVSKFLALAGLPMFDGSHGQGAYMVDEIRYGFLRIRYQDYGSDTPTQIAKLKSAQEALRHYASMITTGSGNYAHSAELVVCRRPEISTRNRGYAHNWVAKEEPKGLLVEQCMILEDVWQAMLKYELTSDWNSDVYTIRDYRKGLRKFASERKAKDKKGKKPLSFTETLLLDRTQSPYPGVEEVCPSYDRSITLDPKEHMELMLRKDEVPESFIDSAAEYAFVKSVLSQLRWYWRPSYSIGPQCNGWTEQKRHMKALNAIANKRAKVENEEDEEEQETDEEDDVVSSPTL
jgi:hypothetical protein